MTPKVLGLFAGKRLYGPTACDSYRVVFPLNELADRGFKADWMPMEQAILAARQGHLDPAEYNIFVLARLISAIGHEYEMEKFITSLKESGRLVICEWDDDYTDEHREVTGEGVATSILSAASAATASTPYLRDVMKQHNDEVHVLPNAINPGMWVPYHQDACRVEKALTVGLVGTETHEQDWRPIAPALRRVADEYPDVGFFVGGYVPDYLKDLPRLALGGKVPFEAYPGLVRQIDIGLAPLDPQDAFNASKSGIKALEYMASVREIADQVHGGVAPIVTDCKVYRRVCNHRHNSLMVKDHNDSHEWYERIKELIEDEHLRLKIQRQGHRWVKKHRSIKNLWREWLNTYRALLNKEISE